MGVAVDLRDFSDWGQRFEIVERIAAQDDGLSPRLARPHARPQSPRRQGLAEAERPAESRMLYTSGGGTTA